MLSTMCVTPMELRTMADKRKAEIDAAVLSYTKKYEAARSRHKA